MSEISQVYLRANWKELMVIINWMGFSLVEEGSTNPFSLLLAGAG